MQNNSCSTTLFPEKKSTLGTNSVDMLLNLTKTEEGAKWGDGTLHKDTEYYKHVTSEMVLNTGYQATIFIIDYYMRINDYFMSYQTYYICQKDVFNF